MLIRGESAEVARNKTRINIGLDFGDSEYLKYCKSDAKMAFYYSIGEQGI